MSIVKQYIKDYRTKSVDKALKNTSYSPNQRPSSKIGVKITTNQQRDRNSNPLNVAMHKKNTVNKKQFHLLASKPVEIEGELDSHQNAHHSSQSKGKANAVDNKLNKNSNPLQMSRVGNFGKKSIYPKKVPRKSPFPIGKDYQNNKILTKSKIGSNNIQRINHQKIASPLFTHKPAFSSTTMSRTFYNNNNKKDRSLSPIYRKKETISKSPINTKPKYVSKSPILGSTLLNRFKNSNVNSHLYSKGGFNKLKNPTSKPVSARNNVIKSGTHKNKQQVVISEDISQDNKNTSHIKNNSSNSTNTNIKASPTVDKNGTNTGNNIIDNKKEETSPTINKDLVKSPEEPKKNIISVNVVKSPKEGPKENILVAKSQNLPRPQKEPEKVRNNFLLSIIERRN